MDRAPLSTWVHSQGKIALLGDACHPMLVICLESVQANSSILNKPFYQPYRAQGAAMAVSSMLSISI